MFVDEYYTKRFGARPFRVLVRSDGWVQVFRPSHAGLDAYEAAPCFASTTVRVFRGDNPGDVGWAPAGPGLDGNTFLFCVGVPADNGGESWRYVYVGQAIREFVTPFEIVRCSSPVTPDGHAYPYAVDDADRVYLLEYMDVVFAPSPAVLSAIDAGLGAYAAYNEAHRITGDDMGQVPASIPGFCEAICWRLNGDARQLRYWPDAAARYDLLEAEYGSEPMFGSEFMALEFADGTIQPLDKNSYVGLLESFGAAAGICPLGATTLAY